MVNSVDNFNSVRPLGSTEATRAVAPIGDARQELYQRSLQRLVGQSLQGQVLSRYSDGSFLIKVADTAARVILPPKTQIGDSLPLTLITVQPRPTFLLGNDANSKQAKSPLIYLDPHGGEEVELSDDAVSTEGQTKSQGQATSERNPNSRLARQFVQIDNLLPPGDRIEAALAKVQTPSSEAPTPAANQSAQSAQTSLSNTGRLINSVLLAAQQQGAPGALTGKTAIVPEPGTVPQQVAAALQETLTYSGLFYESHVSEWVEGKRPMAELMREPQMQAATESGKSTESKGETKAEANSVSFPQLVNLQLNTFEQQSTHWRGEIWPGQTMEWDVQREAGHTPDEPDAPSAWQSTVRFELPNLGTIHANLHLIGDRLHIQVKTGSENTTSALRENAALLADALGAAGSPLDSLLVQQNEPG